jgi:hypothetical protein
VLTRLPMASPGAALFSAPQIDHFVMAITSAEAIVRHTFPPDGLTYPCCG